MVRRQDAPPPGWYPDPTGRSGLLWWDGLDWTRHHRPSPTTVIDDHRPAPVDESAGGQRTGGRSRGAVPTASQLRARSGDAASRKVEREIADAVAEARRVARQEVQRAVQEATSQLGDARDRLRPRFDEYRQRVTRWARIAAVVVVVWVALSAWLGATAQVSLLEWLGERVDTVTGTVGVPADMAAYRTSLVDVPGPGTPGR